MTPQLPIDMAATSPLGRLAGRLSTDMKTEFRKLLANIARDGDLELVREIHLAGALTDDNDRAAVLPLALHAKDKAEGMSLVRDILSAGEVLTARKAAYHFSSTKTADAVEVLVRMGFDPNEWINADIPTAVTPLNTHMSRMKMGSPDLDHLPPTLAILENLRLRDIVPLTRKKGENAWDFFRDAAKAITQMCEPAMDDLMKKEWPESWRTAAARAVLGVVPHEPLPTRNSQSKVLAGLMAKARFDDRAAWTNMLARTDGWGQVSDVGNWLCDPGLCGERGVAAVRNMVDHGVGADDFKINISVERRVSRATLLHCAILLKNAPMVEALLDGGASPDSTVSKHPHHPVNSDVGRSAVSMAEEHFQDALPMLHAKRAKNAIDRTLQQAMAGLPAGGPA